MGVTATKTLNPWKVAGYKAGQPVTCSVLRAEPGGYSVSIAKDKLPGFLATSNKLRTGQEVLARFVCLHNHRILLTCSFTGTSTKVATSSAVAELDKDKASAGNEADAAFNVWAENPTDLPFRRATDLIVPCPDPSSVDTFTIKERGLEWALTDIEGGMRTGCMRITSEKNQTRSAILLYRGRGVGCIFGDKAMGNNVPKELSFSRALKQLEEDENVEVCLYPLPDNLTLPISALFFGYPVERSDNLATRNYLDYLLDWLSNKEQTACIALSFPLHYATCLIFVHQGKFTGAFHVDRQEFSPSIEPVFNLLKAEPSASLEASILPMEILSPAMRFGYSLSMASKKLST